MDQEYARLGQWARRVDDLTNAGEVVMVSAKVGDAVPSIGAREMENVGISGLMPR
jgi:hypothetical protein